MENGQKLKSINVKQPKPLNDQIIANWEVRYPALKALNVATGDKPRGYRVTKPDIVAICGGEKQFRQVAARWKQCILARRGITIEWRAGPRDEPGWYEFLEVSQHLISRHHRLLAGSERRHRAESLRIGLINDGDMSDHERRLRVFAMNQHSDAAGKLSAQRNYLAIAIERPETLPRLAE